jgi:hypothetical protein
MGENTVEITGVAYNAENLLEAAQDVAQQPDGRGMSLVGDICVIDDGHDDGHVEIRKDGRVGSVRGDINTILEKAETELGEGFESYVKHLVGNIDGNIKIGVEVKNHISDMFGHGYDLLLWKHYSLTADLMRELTEDGGIELGYVRPVERGVMVGLNDSRE